MIISSGRHVLRSQAHNISQFIEFADHGRSNKAFASYPAILTDYPSPCVALSIVVRLIINPPATDTLIVSAIRCHADIIFHHAVSARELNTALSKNSGVDTVQDCQRRCGLFPAYREGSTGWYQQPEGDDNVAAFRARLRPAAVA